MLKKVILPAILLTTIGVGAMISEARPSRKTPVSSGNGQNVAGQFDFYVLAP